MLNLANRQMQSLEMFPNEYFYKDDERPARINDKQKEAIDFLFLQRRQHMLDQELDSALESDWLDVSIARVFRPLLNPSNSYLER
jgi:hypothetical protein